MGQIETGDEAIHRQLRLNKGEVFLLDDTLQYGGAESGGRGVKRRRVDKCIE